MSRYSQSALKKSLVSATLLLPLVGVAVVALPNANHIISQRGARFGPSAVSIHPGEHVTLVNDDGDVVHHAYIDAPDLTYDSNDLEPGDKAVIAFPKGGDFEVLCGIHPKMRLAVHVQ